jgi:outer membrane protein OmpA-like peptidoglycan-associated protein
LVCPSCGYKNLNDNAPFCGGCGKPLHAAPVTSETLSATATPKPPIKAVSIRCPFCGHENMSADAPFCAGCGKPLGVATPAAKKDSPSIDDLQKDGLHGARSSMRILGIAVLSACVAIAGGGVAILLRSVRITGHHAIQKVATTSESPAQVGTPPLPSAPLSSTPISPAPVSPTPAPVPADSGAAPAVPEAPPPVGPTPDSTGPCNLASTTEPIQAASIATDLSPRPKPKVVQVTPSPRVPLGRNIAATNFGGEIESVTGSYGPGQSGAMLIDGTGKNTWQADSDPIVYPEDLVFSFYKRDTALVSAVVINRQSRNDDDKIVMEVWVSSDSSPTNFEEVATAALSKRLPLQTVSFMPIEARYVKVRFLSGPDHPSDFLINQIQIIEPFRSGYVSLLERHSDILTLRTNVRYAAQKGINWLEWSAMDWQDHHRCFGCHVQAQTMMGLAIAQTNNYVVNSNALRALACLTATKQHEDGYEKDEGAGNIQTATHFAAMGMAYYDEANGIKTDSTLRRYTDWMINQMEPTGAFPMDYDKPPISQGTINSSANAAVAFMEAYAQTGNSKYKTAADRALAFVASQNAVTTQDEVFKVIALSHFGDSAQRDIAAGLVTRLKAEQDSDGGWRKAPAPTSDAPTQPASDAFATGQVLYAFKEAGVSIEAPEFTKGVRYLISNQDASGAWVGDEESKFAPTMWAVIGLAGNIEVPSASSLKEELDKYGKVVLYINFDFNKATIRPDGKPIVSQIAKLMKDNPNLQVAINGHTDNIGSRDYNTKLSEKRAAAVVDAVVALGIERSRLTSAGFGPDQPIADNSTEKGRAKNRRVELVKM